MSEKNTRSRERAAAALAAYRLAYGTAEADPDDVACIGDLIADLCHLAEQRWTAEQAEQAGTEIAYDGAVTVHGLVLMQLDHYDHERDPANADEEV